MPKVKYNHVRRISGLQNTMPKAILPGMIVRFNYIGKNISDASPIVLIIWNDLIENKFHGINLNYLTESKIKIVFEGLIRGSGGKRSSLSGKENILIEEDPSNPHDEKLTKPDKNLIKDAYTRLRLPTFRDNDSLQRPISLVEAEKEMDILYQKVLKRHVKEHDMYRTYFWDKMNMLKVVTYDIEGLLK